MADLVECLRQVGQAHRQKWLVPDARRAIKHSCIVLGDCSTAMKVLNSIRMEHEAKAKAQSRLRHTVTQRDRTSEDKSSHSPRPAFPSPAMKAPHRRPQVGGTLSQQRFTNNSRYFGLVHNDRGKNFESLAHYFLMR